MAAGARQSLGCDYWATATPNTQLYSGFPFAVALANPHAYPVTVQIEGGALTATRSETLGPGEARAVELPWVDELVQFSRSLPGCACGEYNGRDCINLEPARSARVRGGAYRIRASAPVAAYQFNSLTYETRSPTGECLNSYSNGASLLLSTASLTARYDVVTVARDGWYSGFVAVVATTPEATTVTVRLPANHGVSEAVGRVVQQTELVAGEVMLIAQMSNGDLSGASIEATHPVAVFGGYDCALLPFPDGACDHMEEQMIPRETLGREYVIADLRDRPLGSFVRLMAPADDTSVEFDPPRIALPQRLRAGQVFDVRARESFSVRASRPIRVMQFMPGSPRGDTDGDPEMAQAVPIEQYRDRYDLYVPSTYLTHYLNVVVPRGASALLDETPLEGSVEPLGAWDVIHARVSEGRHVLRTAEGVPLGVTVFGTGTYTSYMYPGGLDLRVIAPL